MPQKPINILLVTGGHPFEEAPFLALFDALQGIEWTHAAQPEAQSYFSVKEASRHDAIVCYDMPGIQFNADGDPDYLEPDEQYKANFLELVESGFGFVFLHHAIASWPTWDEFAEIVGGRWQYLPGKVRGRQLPDSGFVQDATSRIRALRDHPITQGLPESFELIDELYLFEAFEDQVEPLLANDFTYTRDNFNSAAKAIREGTISNEGWDHPAGSNVIGWTRRHDKSRIVYLQSGHDALVYGNRDYQLLLKNAINWAANH